jgi:quercetin dioxygenase-like cupin family protein
MTPRADAGHSTLSRSRFAKEAHMKKFISATFAFILMGGVCAQAERIDPHRTFLPQQMQWGSPPPSLPAGAEAAVLQGDPKAQGPFVLRLRAPKGYAIGPHTHPRTEAVTLISGKISLGLGKEADRASVETLTPGSFATLPHGVLHYLFVDEDAVIQVSADGPFEIEYADPKDDPRLQIAPDGSKSRHTGRSSSER